jgi:hypothetical protein
LAIVLDVPKFPGAPSSGGPPSAQVRAPRPPAARAAQLAHEAMHRLEAAASTGKGGRAVPRRRSARVLPAPFPKDAAVAVRKNGSRIVEN